MSLHYAASSGSFARCREIVAVGGVDLNAKVPIIRSTSSVSVTNLIQNEVGRTALILATTKGHIAIVKFLLSIG